MSEKNDLLEELEVVLNPKRQLDFNYFLYILLTLSFIAMFAFPKVYITQQIYFKSRDISKLKREYNTLREEKKQ